MKKLFILTLLFACLFAKSQPPKGDAHVGSVYGEAITEEAAVPAADLAKLVTSADTVNVKVKAIVNGSCASKGCWLTFKINDQEEAFVKMKDYGFFVPTEIQGKTVVLEGKSFIKMTSVEDLKHYAEDGGKSKKEIDAITQPKKEIRFIAKGILVVKS